MRTFICLAVLSFFLISCANDKNENSSKVTVFISSSTGAFGNGKANKLYPGNAYVTFSSTSTERVSIKVFYSWWKENDGFVIEIPDARISGTINNFSISEDNIPARSKMSFAKADFEDILLSISGSFNKSMKDEPLSLLITPAERNKATSPTLTINKASMDPVNLQPGSNEVEWEYLAKVIFNNKIDIPITIHWQYEYEEIDRHIIINQNASHSFWSDVRIFPQMMSLIVDNNEYKNVFTDGTYSMKDIIGYTLISGAPEEWGYPEYTFDITPELYEELLAAQDSTLEE